MTRQIFSGIWKNWNFLRIFNNIQGKSEICAQALIVNLKSNISVFELSGFLKQIYSLFSLSCSLLQSLPGRKCQLIKQARKGYLSYALKQLVSTQMNKFVSRRLKATKSRVQNEFYILSQLNHPNRVKLLDLFLKTILFILYLN
jgi:hypothetical protein